MSVAVMTPNWLGDLVMSADAVKLLKGTLGGGIGGRGIGEGGVAGGEPLHVWAPAHLAPLAELILDVDAVIPFRLRRHLARLHDRVTLAGRMRARGYRAVVLFPNSLSTALVARMSGAPERVGTPMYSRARLLTTLVAPPRTGEHEGDAYMRVAAAAAGAVLGGAAPGIKEPLPPAGLAAGEPIRIPDAARESARELLRREGLRPEREPFLAMAPGAAYGPAKRYGAEGFARVAREAHASGLRPVIVGARGDADAAREVADLASESRPLDLAGKTDLRELAGVFSLASGFAGNDSGAAHVAAAVGIPTVALFLSTNPVRTAPRGPRVEVLAAEVDCRPCMKRTCPRGTYECRGAISPERMLEALSGLGAFS